MKSLKKGSGGPRRQPMVDEQQAFAVMLRQGVTRPPMSAGVCPSIARPATSWRHGRPVTRDGVTTRVAPAPERFSHQVRIPLTAATAWIPRNYWSTIRTTDHPAIALSRHRRIEPRKRFDARLYVSSCARRPAERPASQRAGGASVLLLRRAALRGAARRS